MARGIFLFLIFACLNTVWMIMKISTTESVAIIISGLQMLPGIAIMCVDMFVFVWNSREIEEFFVDLCRIIEESGEEEMFNKAYKKLMRVNKGLGAFATVSVTGSVTAFLLTGKSVMPIWMPYDHGLWFFASWANQSAFFCYQVLQLWLVETFIFTILSILNAYSLYLRKMTQNMRRDDLVKFVEDYLKFKA